jgi:hypothetical protein
MSSVPSGYFFDPFLLKAVEQSFRSLSGQDSGSTDKPSSIVDPWGGSGTSTPSGKSVATPPTVSSSKTVSKYSPSHYQRGEIEVWDFIVDQKLDYLSGNCVKYICRAGHKTQESELDDWLKVKAYVDKKIALLQYCRNR